MDTEPTEQQAIDSTECPLCMAERGARCVYVMPKKYPGYPSKEWQIARVGYPTKRIHTVRWDQARQAAWRRYRRANERANRRAIVRATPETRAAVHAGQEWDRREYARLVRWFAAYGSILTDQPGGPQ